MGQGPLLDDLDLLSSPHSSRFSLVEIHSLTLNFYKFLLYLYLVSLHSSFKPQKLYLHFPDITDLLQKVFVVIMFVPYSCLTTRKWLDGKHLLIIGTVGHWNESSYILAGTS